MKYYKNSREKVKSQGFYYNIFNYSYSNLKLARQKFGITQEQAARKLNVSTSAIEMYKQWRREPHYDLMIKISKETKSLSQNKHKRCIIAFG